MAIKFLTVTQLITNLCKALSITGKNPRAWVGHASRHKARQNLTIANMKINPFRSTGE
jgi:hypothetical protein